jgi:hypothetical protein
MRPSCLSYWSFFFPPSCTCVWTQGLELAKQVLCHLSHTSNPLLVFFLLRVLILGSITGVFGQFVASLFPLFISVLTHKVSVASDSAVFSQLRLFGGVAPSLWWTVQLRIWTKQFSPGKLFYLWASAFYWWNRDKNNLNSQGCSEAGRGTPTDNR